MREEEGEDGGEGVDEPQHILCSLRVLPRLPLANPLCSRGPLDGWAKERQAVAYPTILVEVGRKLQLLRLLGL